MSQQTAGQAHRSNRLTGYIILPSWTKANNSFTALEKSESGKGAGLCALAVNAET